ncbi:MAG: hypothetical protein ALAOOOJD_04028 [bacterium]|nr:hypothetical protein [bacterium]
METPWNISGRYVDTGLERPRWRFTANYRLLSRLQIGVEFNAAAREVGPLLTWYLLTESHSQPALFLGTSSDRIGSPKGAQSYYLTGAKHLWQLPLSVYASLNYSEWDEGLNFPFGVNVELPLNFSLRQMYDGDRSHLLLAHDYRRFSFSLLYIWYERFGAAMAVGF